MVKFFLILQALLFAENPATPPSVSVELQFSKSKLYAGEQIVAEFVLVGKNPRADVEVVKFPEFRGFWSENQALRQGTLPMMPIFEAPLTNKLLKRPQFIQAGPIKYKGLIGAYTLIPMLMRKDWKIEPMKIFVRGENGEPDQVITHSIPSIQIQPLPPPPSQLEARQFIGAVGQFKIEMDQTDIEFRDSEAAGIRMNLVGEGNFQEIDQLPLSLPAIVEPASHRTFTNVRAGTGLKTFEWDVLVHSEQNFSIDSNRFYFFNPRSEKYDFATLPKLNFVKLAPLPALSPRFQLKPRPLEPQFTAAWSLQKSPLFWGLQFLALLALLSQTILLAFFSKKATTHTKNLTKERFKRMNHLISEKSPDRFIQGAYELVLEDLEQKLGKTLRHLSHREILKSLPEALQSSKADFLVIINSYNSIGYSKHKIPVQDLSSLHENLKNILSKKVA